MLHILFDDCRNLHGMDFIIRSAEAMKQFINKFDTTNHFVYFDSDIGDPNIQGYDILYSLISRGQRPAHIAIVTANPVDAERMRKFLVSKNYVSKDRIQYTYKGTSNE